MPVVEQFDSDVSDDAAPARFKAASTVPVLAIAKGMAFRVFLLSLAIMFGGDKTSAQNLYAQQVADPESLGRTLDAVVAVARERWPHARFYVAGGSGRAFADAALMGRPLKFRDLDLQIVTSEPFGPENMHLFEAAVAEVRGLKRAGDFNATEKEIFFVDGQRSIDISVFPDDSSFEKRGIFDIDTIRAAYPENGGLPRLLADIRAAGYEGAVKAGLIFDPLSAYPRYRRGELQVRAPGMELPFVELATRTVRSVGKLGLTEMPADLRAMLERKRAEPYAFQRRSWAKHLLKVLADDNAAREVKWLAETGVLREWSPEVSDRVLTMTAQEIESWMRAGGESADPLQPFRRLASLASSSEQLRLSRDLLKIGSPFMQRWQDDIHRSAPLCSKVF